MPGGERQPHMLEKRRQAGCLVVDQGLEGADAQAGDPVGLGLCQPRGDGQKGCLGLAAGGRCRDDDVGISVHDLPCRMLLNRPERLPFLFPNPPLNAGVEALERGGGMRVRAGTR